MNPTTTQPLPSAYVSRQREIRRVAIASVIGTSLEWYDFLIYGTVAGIIFNHYYYPHNTSLFISTLLAYGTFASGWLIRPFSGLVFGHFGDRIGRKRLLVLTIIIMGIATVLTGLLPTYAQIGIWAPILLLILRLFQGIGLGGEWGGAVIMAYEFSDPRERIYYASLPQSGLAIGLCLSTGILTLLSYALSNTQFVTWGWRIAFVASIVLVAIGFFIRVRLLETPEFVKQMERGIARVPVWEVFRNDLRNTALGWGVRFVDGIFFIIFAVFVLHYLTNFLNVSRTVVLGAITTGSFIMIFAIPYFSRIADRVGSKKVMVIAALFCGFITAPAIALIYYSGNPIVAFVVIALVFGIGYALIYGPQAGLICSLFDTRVRYTGISAVYQFGAIPSVSMSLLVLTALLHADNGQPWLIVAYAAAAGVITALCVNALKQKVPDPVDAPSSEALGVVGEGREIVE